MGVYSTIVLPYAISFIRNIQYLAYVYASILPVVVNAHWTAMPLDGHAVVVCQVA